jgi:hypothetical protein
MNGFRYFRRLVFLITFLFIVLPVLKDCIR